jgi:hypothetical protein
MFLRKGCLLLMLLSGSLLAEEPFSGFERFFVSPKHYVIAYASSPPVIDGNLDDSVWQNAKWTEDFRDIEGELSNRPVPYYKTRAKMLWDQDYLYIAAALEEKHLWAYLTQRDQIVYNDNDFEVFIDPSNSAQHYFEFEVNAQNTMFDLFLTKPYRSPNCKILIAWNSQGMKHAVQLFGTLNQPDDEDERWTVEIAIPFKDLETVPKDKEIWRMNFSRVEWQTEIRNGQYLRKTDASGKRLPENNWVWSPTGEINMHCPERWGYVMFSAIPSGGTLPDLELPKTELLRQPLWYVYYKQREYRRQHKTYARSLEELHIKPEQQIGGEICTLSLEATTMQFTATITGLNTTLIINHEGWITDRLW